MVCGAASTIIFGRCRREDEYTIVADEPSVFVLPMQRVVQDRVCDGADHRLPNKWHKKWGMYFVGIVEELNRAYRVRI